MGLIRAGAGALGGTMADQWKEFFYCDAIDKDTLVVKGAKRTSSRSSNTKGNDNIISSGSGIAVADGQCAMIVEQGKVVEVCAEPGQFTYDASTEPSIFSGSLGQAILDTFKTIGKRFTLGGDTGKDQRVYYFNTKEIVDNRFGTATPIPFRIVDNRIGLDTDTEVRCNGVYSYKITNPLLFYTNVCGNVEQAYERSEIDSQLKSEFVSALQPAFARLSTFEMRPNQIPAHTIELCDLMNETLTRKWSELRGISVVSIAMNSVSIPEEDAEKLKELQRAAALANPALAAGAVIGAQTDAMRTAAGNSSGAMAGFMGMGMAMNAAGGGMNAQNLFAMGQQQQAQQAAQTPQPTPAPQAAGGWKCACGTTVTGNFCPNCGTKRPAEDEGWTCSCGAVNKGKFCTNCGAKKPAGAPLYRCDKCGWEPEDPKNPPRFCPECGDIFDENDRQ